MSLDTTAPRTRRAVMVSAVGALLGAIGVAARPPAVRAGTDGDVVLDATNTAAGTTVINGDGSNPVFRVANADEDAVQAISQNGVGLMGGSGDTAFPGPIEASTGVYGISVAGHGVYGASDSNAAIYAANNASTVAAIVAEGDPGTAIHGHANAGPVPESPALTGIYGSAAGSGVAIRASSEDGFAVIAESTAGNGVWGRGAGDAVIGESTGEKTGVIGFSGTTDVPGGPAKTGVYGEATQDSNARGVFGNSTSGQGVRGEATSGIGVKAVATTGVALDVAGPAVFSRSGRVSLPAGAKYVDVTVPGGLAGKPNVLATLQLRRGNVHVLAARPNYPSAGKVRIYVSDVASTTAGTPIAWFVLG
jgi:hypothetical protein